MKLLITFLSIFITTVTLAQSTDTFSISGKVLSANNGKAIIGGSVMIGKNIGTSCDTTGQFSISGLRKGKYRLSFRCLDYKNKDTVITIENQSIRNLVLTVAADCKSFNRRKAIKDIKHGKAVLFVNTKASQSDQLANKKFKEKYGIGFEFNDFILPAEECLTIYNQTVFEYLDSKFGKQWRNEIKSRCGWFQMTKNNRTTFASILQACQKC